MQESPKLRVGFITSSILVKTGFSTNIRALLPWLYKRHPEWEFFHLNQCMGEDDPNFKRFPWKNAGAIKKGNFDENKFNTDPNYARWVSYGNARVESWVLENKLDVVIHIEDIWSSPTDVYLNSKWFPYLKENFLQWSTADSLPILPDFKVWAEKCPNLWFWSGFAERALKAEDPEKYKNVSTQYGSLDVTEYFPISKEDKSKFRQRNNIDEDTVLFIQLGRNQLRKLYPCTLESFATFKRENPQIKAKLLFHCSWSEPGGWPMERLVTDLGLKREDVLTTYFCKKCDEWEVKPFEGEGRPCRFCSAPNEQFTAGINSTISNRELSYIYGLADGSISASTSSGLEYTNFQSLLCGIPLLCTEYAGSEDFALLPFVFALDGSYTFEVQTGFKKHVPNQRTMVKFYKKIADLKKSNSPELTKIINDGRNWALKNASVETVGGRLEQWIASRKPIDWNFEYPAYKEKNPNFPAPAIQDNVEWIKSLYKNILMMDVSDNDPGLISWVNGLAQGQTRQVVYDYFVKVANEDNQKNIKPKEFGEVLDKRGKKTVLLVLKESIGDLLYLTCLLPSIAKQYPDYDIYLGCDSAYHEIFDGNSYIYKLLPYHPMMDNELVMTGISNHKGYFDVYINVGVATQKFLNYLTNNNIALSLF